MRNLIAIVAFGLLVVGCNHHDRTKATVYYVYHEPIGDVEEVDEPECEDHDDHGHHHHKHWRHRHRHGHGHHK